MTHALGQRLAGAMGAALLALGCSGNLAAAPGETAVPSQAGAIDYFAPPSLAGTIYAEDSELKQVLFTFRRTATRSNSTIQVTREYLSPEGKVAARELVTYQGDRLVRCELEVLQTGARAKAEVRPDPSGRGEAQIQFEYAKARDAKPKTDHEELKVNTLCGDMIATFIAAHWDKLMAGSAVPFRFVALERAETVGFKLVKVGETTRGGKAAVRIKMEPTSLIIAALVKPLYFTFEQSGEHRILEYAGRTTPKLNKDGKWKDLDAVTVYDWKP
jgi:hypothetical protein